MGMLLKSKSTPSDPGAGLVDHLRRDSAEWSDSSAGGV
jgi:hypothetical protein